MTRRHEALAAALLAAAIACSDGGPDTPQLRDATALATRFETVAAAVDAVPLASFAASAFSMFLAGVEVHSISPLDLGTTLTWDPAAGAFTLSDRTDGPSDGLRVILYAIDGATGLPALPLTEVGTVDLFARNDLLTGTPQDTIALRFLVRGTGASPVTYADFTAWSTYVPGCLCATVEGWVTDGTTRVDFTVPYQITSSGTLSYFGGFSRPSAVFDVTPPGFRFYNDVIINEDRGDFLDYAYQVTVGARFGLLGDSLDAAGSVVVDDAGEATTTVTLGVNGNAYATVALHGGEPTFTTPLNGPLTPDERNALLVVASALFAIGFNIEYPTLMIFWCGC
jgi:hypothetical protein